MDQAIKLLTAIEYFRGPHYDAAAVGLALFEAAS